MKKHNILLMLVCTFSIIACRSNTGVAVVPAIQDMALLPKQTTPLTLPTNLPANVTAICRDGSYSTATDSSACAGNGGVLNFIQRYHAE